MDNIKMNYEYYLRESKKLYKKYPEQYLIIKDAQVESVHSSMDEAVKYAKEHLNLGEFIIQKCQKDEKTNAQMFTSRVSIK